MDATSVISASIQRPSPSDHRVGFSNSFTRLRLGSLALRPALLLFGNLRPRVTTTPLPHATGAYGQFPGRDFNPLDLLLLLRTAKSKTCNKFFSVGSRTFGYQQVRRLSPRIRPYRGSVVPAKSRSVHQAMHRFSSNAESSSYWKMRITRSRRRISVQSLLTSFFLFH